MKNLLLAQDVWINFVEMINEPMVIAAMVLLAVGIAITAVANRIAIAVRKVDKVKPNDSIKISLVCTGIGLIFVGFALIIVACTTNLAGI